MRQAAHHCSRGCSRGRCQSLSSVSCGGTGSRRRPEAAIELDRHRHVPALRARHARDHLPGRRPDQVCRRFLCGGRRHHRASERLGHRRRLHVGGILPRHLRPRLRQWFRRSDLLDRIPGRLADRPLPDRRAAAEPGQIYVLGRGLVSSRPDPDPHSLGGRYACGRRLLSHRADGRCGQAHRTALRPGLPVRGRHRRRADDRLCGVWRHEGHDLGPDHQGVPPPCRRHSDCPDRPLAVWLQP